MFSNDQENETVENPVELEFPKIPLPLSESVTLEVYEEEQRSKEAAERELMESQQVVNKGKKK